MVKQAKYPTRLPQQVIEEANKREEERFAELADLLLHGRLMAHLEQKYPHAPKRAYEIFAETAARVADVAAEVADGGVTVTAEWSYTLTKEPSHDEKLAFLFLGIFGSIFSAASQSRDTSVIRFTTKHRMQEADFLTFQSKRRGYILGKYLSGTCCAVSSIWFVFQLFSKLSDSAGAASPWLIAVSGVAAASFFFAAWWYDYQLIPRPLRIYSGGKFKLKSLRAVEAMRLADVR